MYKGSVTLENSFAILFKARYAITINPVVTLLGIFAREMKTNIYTKPAHESS